MSASKELVELAEMLAHTFKLLNVSERKRSEMLSVLRSKSVPQLTAEELAAVMNTQPALAGACIIFFLTILATKEPIVLEVFNALENRYN